jgi:excisionase family DNA binding protein
MSRNCTHNGPLQKAFYRPDEVAEILGLSRRTIYRMIRDSRLPSVKLNKGPRRISNQALTTLLKSEGD